MGKKSKTLKTKMVSVYWLETIKNGFKATVILCLMFALWMLSIMQILKEAAEEGVKLIPNLSRMMGPLVSMGSSFMKGGSTMSGGGFDIADMTQQFMKSEVGGKIAQKGLNLLTSEKSVALLKEGIDTISTNEKLADLLTDNTTALSLVENAKKFISEDPKKFVETIKKIGMDLLNGPNGQAFIEEGKELLSGEDGAALLNEATKIVGAHGGLGALFSMPNMTGIPGAFAIPGTNGIKTGANGATGANDIPNFSKVSARINGLGPKIQPLMYGFMFIAFLIVVIKLIDIVVYFLRQNIEYETVADKKKWKRSTIMVVFKNVLFFMFITLMILFPIITIVTTVLQEIFQIPYDDIKSIKSIIFYSKILILLGCLLILIILWYI